MPPSRKCASSPAISRAERTSTLEKGSSSRRILGSFSSARASDIRCRMPCEYWPTGRVERRIELHGADHHLAANVVIVNSVQAGEVAQVLHAAHFVVEQRRMRHVAELRADLAQIGGSQHGNAAAGCGSQSGESAQQRGLPCPVVAEDGVEASGGEAGSHSAQGGEASELFD